MLFMKKLFYGLIVSSFFIIAGCNDHSSSSNVGNSIVTQPTKKNLLVLGVQKPYNFIIGDSATESPKVNYITFNINNSTANTYNNIKIKPVITDENNIMLTEEDGLTYTSGLHDNKTDSVPNSDKSAYLYITYTGTQKENLKFTVEISSDNMPVEVVDFGTVSFNTYIQAYLYNETDGANNITPITADTNITSNAGDPIKIIFKNSMEISLFILMQNQIAESGYIQLLTDNITLSDDTICEPCSPSSSTTTINHTFSIGTKNPCCHLDIIQNISDVWSYKLVSTKGDADLSIRGIKKADDINISVQ